MYLSLYHLKENPFQISTDPRFLWLGPKHEEGLATLRYGVLDKKGFLLLTGDVGTGKTTLVNALLNTLGKNTLVAVIRDPNLETLDFFNYISHAFNMGKEFNSKSSFLIYFEQFLNEVHAAGKTVLLIIDEAQRISQELLEEVRLLSNIERHDCKLLNIFFVGQIEFNDILLRPENRAIRQRITVNYTIPALTEAETGLYIQHRLEVAGEPETGTKESVEQDPGPSEAPEIFSPEAVQEIFSFSGGYPRLINIICDRCLLTGFVEDAATITPEIVRECREELRIPESELSRKKNQPTVTEIRQSIPPLEANRLVEEHHAGITDQNIHIPGPETVPTAQGPGNLKKKRHGYLLWLMVVISALLIVLAVGYTNLSQNDDQALLRNMVMQYAEGLKQSIDDQAPSSPKVEEAPSLPGKQEEGFPPEPKGLTQLAEPSTEQKNEDAQRDEEGPAPAEIPGKAAGQVATENIQVQPLLAGEKRLIPFPSDSNYPSSTSLAELNRLTDNLLRQPQLSIVITGYSDSLGNEQYNVKLSEFRANTVKSYLVGRGLPESRIRVEGLGSQNPIAPNDNLSGRSANRRVEIEIIHPPDE